MIGAHDPWTGASNAHLAPPVPVVLPGQGAEPTADVVPRTDVGAEEDASAGCSDALVELVVLVRWVRLVEEAHALECTATECAQEDGRHLLLVLGIAESSATDAER